MVPVNGAALLAGLRSGPTAAMLLGSLLAGSLAAVAAAAGLGADRHHEAVPPGRIVAAAGTLALLMCLTSGWIVLVGAMGLPLVVLEALSSPPALDAWAGRFRPVRRAEHPASEIPASEIPASEHPASEMSDHELCRAWLATSRALRRSPSAGQRLRLAQRRQSYLDELDRRNPIALRAWLDSRGARPDGDPGRFL